MLGADVGVAGGGGLPVAEFVAVEEARVDGPVVDFVAIGDATDVVPVAALVAVDEVVVGSLVTALVAETDGRIEAPASSAVGLLPDRSIGAGVDDGREVAGRLCACSVAIALTVASTDTVDPN